MKYGSTEVSHRVYTIRYMIMTGSTVAPLTATAPYISTPVHQYLDLRIESLPSIQNTYRPFRTYFVPSIVTLDKLVQEVDSVLCSALIDPYLPSVQMHKV